MSYPQVAGQVGLEQGGNSKVISITISVVMELASVDDFSLE